MDCIDIQWRSAPEACDINSVAEVAGIGTRQVRTKASTLSAPVNALLKTRVGFVVGALELGGAERWLISLLKYCDRSCIEWTGVGLVNGARRDSAIMAEVQQYAPVLFGDSIVDGVVARSDVLIAQFVENLAAFTKEFHGRSILVSHMTGDWNAQMISAAARGASQFVAVSKAAATSFPAGRPVTVIYNGADERRVRANRQREEVRREWGLGPQHTAVGFVGRLAPDKAPQIIAQAVARLGGDYRAVFIGGGPFREEVARSIISADPRAVIRPAVSDVGNVLAALDCFVLASPGEGFSLALAEAWLAGVPTVASSVGAVGELEERHGPMTVRVSCTPNAEEVSTAIANAISGANAEIVERARRVVESNYTARLMASRWTRLLTDVRCDDSRLAPITMPSYTREVEQDARKSNDSFSSECLAHSPFQAANHNLRSGTRAAVEPHSSCETCPRLRVGVICNSLLLGGAETWVASLVRNLDGERLSVSGVSQLIDTLSYPSLVDRIAEVAPLYVGKAGIEKLASESDLLVCWGVRQLDSLIPESFTGKVVLVAHGRNEWDAGVVNEAACRATHYVAVSGWAAHTFRDTGHTERPVAVIHNGADIDRCSEVVSRDETRAVWGIHPDEIAIGYLGGIKKAFKNPLAAAKAAGHLGEPYRAVYVGPDYDNLSAEIRLLSPNAVIREPDFQPGNALAGFDCFMLASTTEGFSLALTEAWLAGVPTVATPVGAVPELEQEHGRLTVRVSVGASPEELGAAVKRALSPENREVVERAKRVACSHYTSAAMGRRWSDYLLSLGRDSRPVSAIALAPPPSVSIIVAARNYGHFLRDCLESCLLQTVKPIDVIYSDDFSDDDSLSISRSIRGVTVLEAERHHGVCVARNRGVRASKGEVLIHVDGDDTLPPNYIERHLAALTEKSPFVYGSHKPFGDMTGFWHVPEWDAEGSSRLLAGNFVSTSAAVWRWAFDAVGGWQETSAGTAWDWYMALRLATLGTPAKSDAVLNYRKHGGSYSQTKGEQAPGVVLPNLMAKIREDFQAFQCKPSVSAICALSKPGLAPLALRCWQMAAPAYREIVFGCAPGLPDETWDMLHAMSRTQFHEGTNNREDAGEVRFGLLDKATGDWIANIDDDDLWIILPDLSKIPDNVGIISGAGLFFEFHLPPNDPKHVELHDGIEISRPAMANKLRGSHWLVRRKAWEQISAKMDRTFWFSDWRLAYRIIEAGWKALSLPKPLGIVRRYSFDYPKGQAWDWHEHAKSMAENKP